MKSVVLLWLLLLASRAGYAQSAVTSEYEKSPAEIFELEKNRRVAAEQQELFRMRVAIPDAVGDDVPSAYASARDEAPAQDPVAAVRTGANLPGLFLFGAFILTGLLVVLKLFPGLFQSFSQQFKPWVNRPASSSDPSGGVRAEEEAFSQFLATFHTGPKATLRFASQSGAGPDPFNAPESEATNAPLRRNAVDAFCGVAATILVAQQKLLQEIGRARDEGARQRLLVDLFHEMRHLKGESCLPEVLPVWQMASALEGLLKQLTHNIRNVNASTMRTVARGVELLGELCRPGLTPDLLAARPLRLLVVDDDRISRKAVSLALKRALTSPDLTEDGETALFEVSRQPYDVIFLAAQLPGLDGFQLCSKIHGTVANRRTPVALITCLADFNARAQSTLSGDCDLIAKPFLIFEITVKALTLALQGRLREHEESSGSGPAAADLSTTTDVTRTEAQVAVSGAGSAAPFSTSTDCAWSSQSFLPMSAPGWPDPAGGVLSPADEIATEFLSRASAQLQHLRDQFQAMFQTTDEAARQDILADVYVRIHSFTPKADLPAMHPAIQMSAALEGLTRKLLEDARRSTVSTLITVAAGMEVLNDLCELGLNSDLVTHPPIRMLVVDDDPVARRVVVGTLQLVFAKPESADSGAAALALTAAKPFDVIFLDVQMPGMDGFEVCANIRESGLNRNTPVVFVSGQNDFNVRNQMSASGGSDFVSKPLLTAEITVKALTFALRSRLQKLVTRRV